MTTSKREPRQLGAIATLATGYWAIYILEYWSGIQTVVVPELWSWLNCYLFKILLLVLIAIVFVACRPPRRAIVACDVAFALCTEAGVLLLPPACAGTIEAVTPLAASTMLDAGLAWSIVRWGQRYTTVPLRQAFLAFILGSIAISLTKIVLVFLPTVSNAALLVVMPLLTYLLLRRHGTGCDDIAGPKGSGEGFGLKFLGITVAGTVFFLTWAYINIASKAKIGHYNSGAFSPSIVVFSQAVVLVFFAAAWWWSFKLRRDIDLEGLWRFAFLWLAAAVAASAIFDFGLLSQAFTSAAFETVHCVLCLSITAYCRHTRIHPFTVVALGNLPFVGSEWAARAFIGATGVPNMDVVSSSVILFSIVVTVVLLMPGRSADAQIMAAGLNEETPDLRQGETEDARFAELALAYDLTEREVQVARHICHGRTKQYIAETLVLSENTIRTYSRRVYQKLGVHSRGELQALVWGEDS